MAYNLTAELSIREHIVGLAQAKRKLKRELGSHVIKVQLDTTKLIAQLRTLNGTLTTTKNLADGVSKSFAAIKSPNIKVTTIQKTVTELRNVSAAAKQVDTSFAASAKRIAQFSTVVGGLYLGARRLREGLSSAVEYQAQLVKLGQISNQSLSSVTKFGAGIRSVGKGLGVSSQELAQVSTILSSAEFSLNEISELLPTIARAKLAPNFESLDSLSNGLVVLRSFVSETEDYGKALGTINELSNRFSVESESLVASLKRAGSTYAATSKDLAGFFALGTTLKATTRESDATLGTSLRSQLQKLQSSQAIDTVAGLDGSLTTAEGGAKAPIDAYRELARLQKELSKTPAGALKFNQSIENLFGGFQAGRARAIISNIELLEKAYKAAQEGSDSLDRNARLAQQSIRNELDRTKEAFAGLFDSAVNSQGFNSSVRSLLELTRGLAGAAEKLLPLSPILLAILAGKGINRGLGAAGGFIGGLNTSTPQGSRLSNFTGANSPVANPRTQLLSLYRDEVRIRRANLSAVEQETLARQLTSRALRENSTVLTSRAKITQVTGFGGTSSFLRNRNGGIRGGIKAGLGGLAAAGLVAAGSGSFGEAIGGATVGASSGAFLGGSVGGPVGAVLGGLVGGLIGFAQAVEQSKKALEQETQQRTFKTATEAPSPQATKAFLDSINKMQIQAPSLGFNSFFGSREDTIARFEQANKELRERKGDAAKPFADFLKGQIEGEISSGRAKSIDDLVKTFGDINSAADLSNDGLLNMNAGLTDFANKLLFEAGTIREATQQIQATRNGSEKIALGLRRAAGNIRDNTPDRLSSIKNPLFDDFIGLNNLGSKSFAKDVNKLGLGGNTQLLGINKAATVLENALAKGGFSEQAFATEIRDALTKGGVSGDIAGNVFAELSTLKFDDFKKSLDDVPQATSKLLDSYSRQIAGVKEVAEATRQMRARMLENAQALQQQRESFRSVKFNATLGQLDLNDERARFRRSPLDINGGENALLDSVGGSGRQLGQALLELQKEFQRTADVRLSVEAHDLASRLNQLGDSSIRLRNIQEEQSRIQSSIAGRENYLASYFTADSEGRRQIDKDLENAKLAQKGGLDALNIEQQGGAVRFLQSISDVSDFNGSGKTGGEILSQLLRQARPEFFRGDVQRNNELQAIKETRMADSIAARQALAEYERQNLTQMQDMFDRMNATLKEINLPEAITIGGRMEFNVTVNGNEAWAKLEPELVALVQREVAKVVPVNPRQLDGPSAGGVKGYYSNGKGF